MVFVAERDDQPIRATLNGEDGKDYIKFDPLWVFDDDDTVLRLARRALGEGEAQLPTLRDGAERHVRRATARLHELLFADGELPAWWPQTEPATEPDTEKEEVH